jgi:drug/metabolite transporter (DMT)-like permease
MIALPLSIICSAYLVLCFKYFEKFGIQNLQAIVFNYIICVITGVMITNDLPDASVFHRPWFPVAAFLGCCFFCIFNVMAYVARNIGVTMTSVASKLSMVIPVSVAIALYHQPLTLVKVIAIVLAIVAVIFTSERSTDDSVHPKGLVVHVSTRSFMHKKSFGVLMALLIFVGSGLNDSLVNFASEKLMNADEFNAFNIVIFSFAALCGILVLLARFIWKGETLSTKAMIGGIVLGIPNYFSLLFLIEALTYPSWQSSVIFPVNNMGVVILTAAAAFILFRERLSKLNWIGMTIALFSIALLIFAE